MTHYCPSCGTEMRQVYEEKKLPREIWHCPICYTKTLVDLRWHVTIWKKVGRMHEQMLTKTFNTRDEAAKWVTDRYPGYQVSWFPKRLRCSVVMD